MRLQDLHEARYKGNLGMMEMFKFYQDATVEEAAKMRKLIASKKYAEAWKFLQQKTGMKLEPMDDDPEES